ncbi:MAG: hypothetical protein KF684_04600 [Phycisphaeraceae bacterium]|nr:hypothetical protein [Phycisphaeraceae bacterium]
MRISPSALSLVAGLLAIAPLSHAGVGVYGRGFSWAQVDNGGISDGSGANLSNFLTFDLFLNAGDQSMSVNGFNLGTAANPNLAPYRIFTDGAVFNHALGGNSSPNPALFPAFPALAFDTYLAVGNGAYADVPGSVNLSGANGEFIGTWFTQPPQVVAAGGSLFVGRFTVSDTATFLGGNGSAIEVSFTGFEEVFKVPRVRSEPAAPGAAGVLALGAFAATRRRRA